MHRAARRILVTCVCGLAALVVLVGTAGAGVGEAWPARPLSPETLARLSARSLPVLDDGSADLRQRRLTGEKAPPRLEAIVVMCDFADSVFYGREGAPDVPDTARSNQFAFHYAAHDSLYYDHLLRDVADYYASVSGGRFTLEYTVHGRIVNLPRPMAWYGDHPDEGEQTVLLAAELVDSLDVEIDFSRYDTVVLIHAGAGGETDVLGDSPEQIFSTYLSPEDFQQAFDDTVLATPYIPSQDFPEGEGIRHVLVLPENEFQDPGFGGMVGSLGVYCFELGLRLGMLSLSDFTPSGFPDSFGIGQLGLMGLGLYVAAGYIPPEPIAFNKLLMGWLDPYVPDPARGAVWTLFPSERPDHPESCARIDITGREYWLVEYRQQDPDGNGIFSFAGDLNGDNYPSFTRIDDHDYVPPFFEFFDPAVHVKERLTGAEWDNNMTEYRDPELGRTVKATGSGLYVWHVDEGVIQSVFAAERNLFNADPDHKSVDLEEADGIQDLDSREPSPYMLGGPDDSFRGEDARVFGPDTRPSTVTAAGVWTGIAMAEISPVVIDSSVVVGDATVIDYADSMTFRLLREAPPAGAPELAASVTLPEGVDLAGAHPLAADLDQDGDGLEILATGRDGAVVVLDWPDPEPRILYAIDAGDTVRFRQPGAAGRLEGAPQAGGLDIVLTSDRGVHRLRYESGGLAFQGADPLGLVTSDLKCPLPPLLLPAGGDPDGEADATTPVRAWVVDRGPDGDTLHWVSLTGVSRGIDPGSGRVVSPLVHGRGGLLLAALADSSDGTGALFTWYGGPQPTDPVAGTTELRFGPGPLPVGPTPREGRLEVAIPDSSGVVTSVDVPLDLDHPARPPLTWGVATAVRSPFGLGLSLVGDDRVGRATPDGLWQDGWPSVPFPALETAADPARAAQPLAAPGGTLFASADGRLFLYDDRGALRPGWPVAGPADVAGTPVVADLDGDGQAELVAVGAFARIAGRDAQERGLETVAVSEIRVWTGLGDLGDRPREWGGNAWRSAWAAAPAPPAPGQDRPLLAGSHLCYPSPATEPVLKVRATAGQAGRARTWIYNLEGETVATSGWQAVTAGEPFEIEVDLEAAASGLYVCRLVVAGDVGGEDTSVKTIAVVR